MLNALIERGRCSSFPRAYCPIKAPTSKPNKNPAKPNKAPAWLIWQIRLSASGSLLGVDQLPEKTEFFVPKTGARTSNVLPNVAADNAEYALGMGGKSSKVVQNHRAFLDLLRLTPGSAARAVDTYLTNNDTHKLLPKGAKAGDWVVFDVEGHPQWWLDDEVVAFQQQRFSEWNTDKGQVGACIFCGQVKLLAKYVPKAQNIGHLSSFNKSATWSYGRQNGYNAPTCQDCAIDIVRGIDDVFRNRKGHVEKPIWDEEFYLVWWPTNPRGPAPWPLFKEFLAGSPDALDTLQDGHLAILEQMKARVALRRYVRVNANTVRAEAPRWRAFFGDEKVWTVAASLTYEGRQTKTNGDQIVRNMADLYLTLLTGEPPPPRLGITARDRCEADPDFGRHTHVRRRAFLTFIGSDLAQENDMTNREKCAKYTGRAYGRAEYVQKIVRKFPQRTIVDRQGRAASQDPQLAMSIIVRTARWPGGRDKDPRFDKEATRLLLMATEIVDGEMPSLFTPREQMYFNLGLVEQQKLDWAPKDKPATTPPATTTTTTTAP